MVNEEDKSKLVNTQGKINLNKKENLPKLNSVENKQILDEQFKKLSEKYEENKKNPKPYSAKIIYSKPITQKIYLSPQKSYNVLDKNSFQQTGKDIIIEKLNNKNNSTEEKNKPDQETASTETQSIETKLIEEEKPLNSIQNTTTVIKISKIEEKPYNPFEPTKVTEYAFSTVLILALFISLVNFPLGQFMSWDGESKLEFAVGWPMPFFQVSMNEPNSIPLNFVGLLVDLALYLIVAYLIDIIFGFIAFTLKRQRKELVNVEKEIDTRTEEPINSNYSEEKITENKTEIKTQPIIKTSIFTRKEIQKPVEIKTELKEAEKEKIVVEKAIENKQIADPKKEVYMQAKKVYEHHKQKGVSEDKIKEMFKQKGWKDDDIKKILQA